MTHDILTIIWKEYNEFLHQRDSARTTLLMLLVPAVLIGVLFPLQTGASWVETPVSIISMAWLPLILVMNMISDAFAGERERHTIETLLATRLPDRAILFGKMIAAMGYALSMTVVVFLLGTATVNIVHGDGTFLFFPLRYIVVSAVVCFLMAWFMAGAGMLVAVRAKTVKQAHQILSFGFIALWFIPMILIQIFPKETVRAALEPLKAIGPRNVLIAAVSFFFVLDCVLTLLAVKRFKREKMIGE